MRSVFIALSFLFALGCSTPAERARGIPGKLVYIRDANADLCFAYRPYGDSMQGMLTWVPCTDKVMTLIVNDAERMPTPR